MSQYFQPYNTSTKNIKVKLDLSNYVTKDDKTDILKLEDKIKEIACRCFQIFFADVY